MQPQPICFRCGRTPEETGDYDEFAREEGMTPTEYVLKEEGTLNPRNNHFACDGCYIAIGMPTSLMGWRAP